MKNRRAAQTIKDYLPRVHRTTDLHMTTPKSSSAGGPVHSWALKNITGRWSHSITVKRFEHGFRRGPIREWTRRVTFHSAERRGVLRYEATAGHRYAIIPERLSDGLSRATYRVALVRPDPDQVDSDICFTSFCSRPHNRVLCWQVIESNVITAGNR